LTVERFEFKNTERVELAAFDENVVYDQIADMYRTWTNAVRKPAQELQATYGIKPGDATKLKKDAVALSLELEKALDKAGAVIKAIAKLEAGVGRNR
jgi:hypothetical protein